MEWSIPKNDKYTLNANKKEWSMKINRITPLCKKLDKFSKYIQKGYYF